MNRSGYFSCVARSTYPQCAPHDQMRCLRQERHGNGEIHYHVALVSEGERNFRFGPIKDFIRSEHHLETHWSGHGGYSTAVAYGYVPSPKKPRKEMDPTPLRWGRVAAFGARYLHPVMRDASYISVVIHESETSVMRYGSRGVRSVPTRRSRRHPASLLRRLLVSRSARRTAWTVRRQGSQNGASGTQTSAPSSSLRISRTTRTGRPMRGSA